MDYIIGLINPDLLYWIKVGVCLLALFVTCVVYCLSMDNMDAYITRKAKGEPRGEFDTMSMVMEIVAYMFLYLLTIEMIVRTKYGSGPVDDLVFAGINIGMVFVVILFRSVVKRDEFANGVLNKLVYKLEHFRIW